MKDREVIETLNDMKGVFGERGHSQYSLYAIDRAIIAIEEVKYVSIEPYDKNGKNLIDRDVVLDYLKEELENILQPKKDKPIPIEARTGAILSIRAMIKFIEGLECR